MQFVELGYIFIVGSSLVLLFIVCAFALRNLNIAGSKAFVLQIVCVTIWSLGSLFEMLSETEQSMLLWRNIEQIGIFLLPVACVYFAVDYSGYDRLKKYLPLLLVIPCVAILLIFTDSSTHLMRTGYTISSSQMFGKALSVHQTLLGKVLVSFNYLLVMISLVTLFVFSRKVTKSLRKQVVLILIAQGLVFVLSLLKSAFLEGTSINIPIVAMYLPGALILFSNLFSNNLFRVSPIAREKVFDVIEMGLLVTDITGMISDTNPCATKILGSSFCIQEKLTGTKMSDVFVSFPEWVELTKQNTAGELELRLTCGKVSFIHIRVYPLQNHAGTQIGSVSIMRDVTELRVQELTLKAKAETDNLTGLMNRESFSEAFSKKLFEAVLLGESVSVLMMDLDKFKSINDTYGHDAGDRVLKAFAGVLRDVLRREDLVARIGGDEFEALLPGVGSKEALEIANRILKAANQCVVTVGDDVKVQLKLSIGVCDNGASEDESEILKYADKAMYMAKNGAGNRCVVWE